MTVICTDYSAKAAICLAKKLIIVYYSEYGVPGLDQYSKFSINTQFVLQVPEKRQRQKHHTHKDTGTCVPSRHRSECMMGVKHE